MLDQNGGRESIGLTGQFSAVDGLLTGEENLLLMARLRRLDLSIHTPDLDDVSFALTDTKGIAS